ncbi:MAG: nucleotide exchange factor GrpE [Chloroflexi bacterium]|nr:nucleotide exchange factor GrpE [Chloroflexota bacterium]
MNDELHQDSNQPGADTPAHDAAESDATAGARNGQEPVAPEANMEEEETPLTVQLEQAEARAQEYLDSLQRERAAFQNYKRRVERERDDQRQQLTGSVLARFLPVLDDFYRAMEAVPADQCDQWYEGVLLIQRKLERVLQDEGVSEIEALGLEFDPNFHEAVGVDEGVEAESGTITQVLLRGYKHGDRVLRPAMVRVAG